MKPLNVLPAKATRTIVFVGGDKGGVGKSTVARTLLEFYQQQKVDLLVFDGDDTNPTLTRFYKQAVRLSTRSAEGFDPLLAKLEGGPAVQLVDLGAGSSIALKQFVDRVGFLDLAQEYGVKVTFVFVLAPTKDSIKLLNVLSEQYGDRIDYVVARNERNEGAWDLWEKSRTRAKVVEELGGIEITIPTLDPWTAEKVDRGDLMWGAALQDRALLLVRRSQIFRWRNHVFAELAKIQEILL